MHVYMLPGCPFAHRATFALREKQSAFEPRIFQFGKRPTELEAAGPFAKSPTLFDGDAVVWDSQLVLEYIDEQYPTPPLLPRAAADRARVRTTAARVDREITALHGPLVMEIMQKPQGQRDEAKLAQGRQSVIAAYAPWNDRLKDREWLVGDELTIADITLYTPIVAGRGMLEIDVPPELTHLTAWLARMSERPSSALVTG